MDVQLTTSQVWDAIDKELFAIIGMVTANDEARTVGVVYIVRHRRLYVASAADTWKVKHIRRNPHVSVTVPIHKHVPLMPWLKIPAATITFAGVAEILNPEEASPEIVAAIFRDTAEDPQMLADSSLIEITPVKDFVTFGVGVPLLKMRDPALARGRAPVASGGAQALS